MKPAHYRCPEFQMSTSSIIPCYWHGTYTFYKKIPSLSTTTRLYRAGAQYDLQRLRRSRAKWFSSGPSPKHLKDSRELVWLWFKGRQTGEKLKGRALERVSLILGSFTEWMIYCRALLYLVYPFKCRSLRIGHRIMPVHSVPLWRQVDMCAITQCLCLKRARYFQL